MQALACLLYSHQSRWTQYRIIFIIRKLLLFVYVRILQIISVYFE